ncbi:hypothetical protein DAPPUDRAFT_325092 [Daphnia pulex]|uniref:Ig-like domain-containing protein n=1 Tax=Daphnia pulex TaxID=6669 RepID=E9H3P4_DAPPU|nr:hypothetical protein DAPPUDRAFT_325092 [Daphnia pulex]|eukprot:EFX73545.1 hypothetical protein DAPPUDRAFT_325092 [Daphnia pulex]
MGQYQCEATRSNSSKKSVPTKFKMEIHGLQVQSNFDPFTPIVEGDQITLTCRSKNKDVMDLVWRWLPTVPLPYQTIPFMEINTTRLPADEKGYLLPFENETRDQDYPPPLGTFQVHRLKWTNFPVEANGIYQCYDANNLNIPISNITVNVAGSKAPVIIDSEDEEIDVYPGNEFSLECNSAFPKPKIQWFMRIVRQILK